MRIGRLGLSLSVLATALLASSAAFAGPVSDLGGIYVPVGNDFITQTDYETLITGTSSNFEGVGYVTGISDGGANVTYGISGVNPPPYLYDEFSGFTVDTITSAVVNGFSGYQIDLKGGQLDYYSFASNQLSTILGASTPGGAVADVESGSLWLALKPQAFNAAGDTVSIFVPGGNLNNVDNSSADAYVDVVLGAGAGTADAAFDTCTIADSNATGASCPLGEVNLSFVGGANSSNAATAFQVSGTDSLKAVSVPEPLTISLFGAGLIGAAALRRCQAKKV